MSGAVLFRTRDLVRWCGVDQKSVINWGDAGKLAFASTPGGHRRYKPMDVKVFLRRCGYDVPPEVLAAAPDASRAAAAGE